MTVRPQATPDKFSDFFKHHGFWAPGVRWFRRIDFKGKALTISLIFAIPLFWLSWQYFGDKATLIEFSARERLGVRYAQALMPVMSAWQAQRAAALSQAAGGPPMGAMAALDGQSLSKAWSDLEAAQQQLGETLGTDAAHRALLEAHRPLVSPSAGFDVAWSAHNRQLDRLLTLLAASTDGSNLTLDPDIDSYYLMDASMSRLPMLSEHLAQLGDLGAALLGPVAATPAQLRRVTELLVLAQGQLQSVRDGLDKVYAYNANVRAPIDAEPALRQIEVFLRQSEAALLNPAGPHGQPAAQREAAASALRQLNGLVARSTAQMDGLIASRVQGMTRARDITTLVMAVCTVAALYLFLAFKKVLDGGLREIALHLNAMREGDLTTRPRAWGRDEIAQLIRCLVDMQESLASIVQQVRQSSDSLLHGAHEISQGSTELSARTEANAATLQQTAASMSDISGAAHASADSSRDASRMAHDNADTATEGMTVIRQVLASMDAVKDSSCQIGDITAVIDGIAFQTNILALNAAVEAARAGEQGKGFAVVAGEVRALSLRSAQAAQQIKSLIDDSMGRVDESNRVARSAGQAIGTLADNAHRMKSLLAEIAASASRQDASVGDIGSAVRDLDQSTQQNSALVEETAAAALSMTSLAQQLAQRVAMFRLAG